MKNNKLKKKLKLLVRREKTMKKRKLIKKIGVAAITAAMVLTSVFSISTLTVKAEEIDTQEHVLGSVSDVRQEGNKVYITYVSGKKQRLLF